MVKEDKIKIGAQVQASDRKCTDVHVSMDKAHTAACKGSFLSVFMAWLGKF